MVSKGELPAESVDNTSQKVVKIDADAYERLTITKEVLRKYLNRKLTYGETIRWLTIAASDRMNALYQSSRMVENDWSTAVGAESKLNEPDYMQRYRDIYRHNRMTLGKTDQRG